MDNPQMIVDYIMGDIDKDVPYTFFVKEFIQAEVDVLTEHDE